MKIKHLKNLNDLQGDEYTEIFANLSRPFKCTFCCCNRPEMTANITNNSNVGVVKDPFSCCNQTYNIYSNDALKWKIFTTCCQCGIGCRECCGACSDAYFPIFKGDETDTDFQNSQGMIKKVFKGWQELVTDADTFEIEFPSAATAEEKFFLIACGLLIDYRLYEQNSNRNSRY